MATTVTIKATMNELLAACDQLAAQKVKPYGRGARPFQPGRGIAAAKRSIKKVKSADRVLAPEAPQVLRIGWAPL